MRRLGAAAGWMATIMLFAVKGAFAISTVMQVETTMQMTWQLSAPAAGEEERDLLRREYRLTQASSEFWVGFDSLNARIHGASELLRYLRGHVDGAALPVAKPQPLLAGLDSPATAPDAAALPPPSPAAPAHPVVEAAGMGWALGAGVLGLLTLFLLRRRGEKTRLRPIPAGRVGQAKAIPQAMPAAPEAIETPQAPETPPQAADDANGLKRHTVPLPEEAPPPPVDRVREEMDHALDIAEVMLSYGRTTGAMQALKDYLHEHPAVSVRPWLKLLDLHRQTGMREDFERTAETVHRHFNVKVPGWDEGVSGEPLRSFFEEEGERVEILGLEQIPHLLAKIQAAWPEVSCLEFLQHLLVDNRGGGRMGFPVSVVAEILLLEDILNDRLAGHA